MEKIATEQFIVSGTKKLRCGITTGSCGAMAALASTEAVLGGKFPEYVKITTPKGWIAKAEILEPKFISKNNAVCAVQKDAGDDPDATDGILIFAEAKILSEKTDSVSKSSVRITAGVGIGKITKSGLDQKVGEFAINSVPRKMIEESVESVCKKYGFSGEIEIKLSCPEGVEIAKKTFNPILGIQGGISILGTTGVVEPMSETALIESLEVEIRVIAESLRGKAVRPLVITPGNYGVDFIRKYPEIEKLPQLKCSNFIGNAIDLASLYDFTHVFFIGHAGKFVKLAGGIFNTHSHIADCRMEIIASHGALCGAEQFDVARIFNCATVDAAFEILDESNATQMVVNSIVRSAQKRIAQKVQGKYKFGFLMFSNERGLLGKTKDFDFLLKEVI